MGVRVRVRTTPDGRERRCNIVPYADRMVVFRSDRVEHKAMPSRRRERVVVIVWLCGRILVDSGGNSKVEDRVVVVGKDTDGGNAVEEGRLDSDDRRPLLTNDDVEGGGGTGPDDTDEDADDNDSTDIDLKIYTPRRRRHRPERYRPRRYW